MGFVVVILMTWGRYVRILVEAVALYHLMTNCISVDRNESGYLYYMYFINGEESSINHCRGEKSQ